MATIAILGAGMMGTAFCVPAADNGHTVRLVGTHLDREIIDALQRTGQHPRLQVPMPANISFHQLEDLAQALAGADVAGIGVNSRGFRWAGETLAPLLKPDQHLIFITKGLEAQVDGTLKTLPDVLTSLLPARLRSSIHPNAVTGPCIAGELARRRQSSVVFAGRAASALSQLRDLFSNTYYHVWTTTDVIGAEVCAAMKNAYAMAVGLGAGVHARQGGQPGAIANHNYEAAIVGQACREMAMMVKLMGGNVERVYGLCGAGDLYVTVMGGRSIRLGYLLGSGLSYEAAKAELAGETLESTEIVNVVGQALPRLAERNLLALADFPLMQHLYAVLYQGAELNVPFERFTAG